MNTQDIAARLEALGNPTRLEIVRRLVRTGSSGLPVGSLRERIGIAASTLSHHLNKLITVGLVSQERRGTTLICRAEFEAMKDTADYLIAECCAEERGDAAEGVCCEPGERGAENGDCCSAAPSEGEACCAARREPVGSD